MSCPQVSSAGLTSCTIVAFVCSSCNVILFEGENYVKQSRNGGWDFEISVMKNTI